MRTLMFKLATLATLAASTVMISGRAEAAALPAPNGLAVAIDGLGLIENSQYSYGGRRYCWYDDGWNDAGWYWCGYNYRRGFGWGGSRGYRGWGVPGGGRRFGGEQRFNNGGGGGQRFGNGGGGNQRFNNGGGGGQRFNNGGGGGAQRFGNGGGGAGGQRFGNGGGGGAPKGGGGGQRGGGNPKGGGGNPKGQ
jgi:hypothetical protein